MTRALLPLLLLSACSPGTIVLADDTSAAKDATDDTAIGDTADSGVDTVDTDTEPVLVPDYSVWDSTRRFYYDYSDYGFECDETVIDSGEAVSEGSSDYDALAEMCGDCDYFYEVTPSADEACGWISLGTTWRGVVLGEDGAEVYFLREADGGLEIYAEDDAAAFDGQIIDWAYDLEYYSGVVVEVTGTVTYPLVEQE